MEFIHITYIYILTIIYYYFIELEEHYFSYV